MGSFVTDCPDWLVALVDGGSGSDVHTGQVTPVSFTLTLPDTDFYLQELEAYSMGVLPDGQARDFEIHLLIRERCRECLADMDAFVAAMSAECAGLRAGRVIRRPARMSTSLSGTD